MLLAAVLTSTFPFATDSEIEDMALVFCDTASGFDTGAAFVVGLALSLPDQAAEAGAVLGALDAVGDWCPSSKANRIIGEGADFVGTL